MKYCVHCGAELEPGATFCTKCGAKVEADPNSASWIKAEKQQKKKNSQNTMVFGNRPERTAPEGNPDEEVDEKNRRTNNILTGVLIGLLVVAVAVGGFFIWRNQAQKNGNRRRPGQTQVDSNQRGGNSNREIGQADILSPSAEGEEGITVRGNQVYKNGSRDTYSGLANNHGQTHYISNGHVNRGFTGVVPDENGKQYLVVDGRGLYGYTGTISNGTNTYRVRNGEVISSSGPSTTASTTADEENEGVDTTQYDEDNTENGAQQFSDFGYEDNDTYINQDVKDIEPGVVDYDLDSVAYDDDNNGNYVVTFVIRNSTDHPITVARIDNIELRDGGGETLATGTIDDIDPQEIEPNDSLTLSTTLENENHSDDDLSNASVLLTLIDENGNAIEN